MSAADYLPSELSLKALQVSSRDCHGCELYQRATQTVFGEGSPGARIMFIGEQPGDEEDLRGHPFVGPAGRLLNELLAEAGIERRDAYVTNVVKHFKWEPRGKRRIHQKPGAGEVKACLPWLQAEIEVMQPKILVLLGATAAQALLGKSFRVTEQRGQKLDYAQRLALATVHPSSILRQRTSQDRARERRLFIQDMLRVRELMSLE
ncbi:MAG: UdgX family uracil-DNA binding protein [Candidatus Eremiobacteraeota bacterium]|nr:UdgX family uracil-DNA binding protein [Candidatus Eremiobacteraeota bacterium]MCW5867156.1 UdgX family uracil-DNA binding protein [Candidatus Eremiobacteraeota bacterium]